MDAVEMALLLDYYGPLLTEKQRTCCDLRFNQDLSLGEIGEVLGISRQAVCDNLARTESILRKLEQALGCVGRDRKLRQGLRAIREAAQGLTRSPDESVSAAARQILAAARALEE